MTFCKGFLLVLAPPSILLIRFRPDDYFVFWLVSVPWTVFLIGPRPFGRYPD